MHSTLSDDIIRIGPDQLEDWWTVLGVLSGQLLLIHTGDAEKIVRLEIPADGFPAAKFRDPDGEIPVVRRPIKVTGDNLVKYKVRPWDLMCLRSAAATVIRQDTGEVLVLRQPDGTVVLPGGKAAVPVVPTIVGVGFVGAATTYEASSETALRELCEETLTPATIWHAQDWVDNGEAPDGYGRVCASWMTTLPGVIAQDMSFPGYADAPMLDRFPEGTPCWAGAHKLVEAGNRYRDWYGQMLAHTASNLARLIP